MIRKISVYEAESTDPEKNLAVEEYLLFHTEPDECILYLWQNEHTVVVGKNQNCWKECDVTRLNAEGGRLVRRLSGGGAVYHDLGNLNFTFLVRKENYDLQRQIRVIAKAVERFGIPVEQSGRNDLLAAGRKFSGNAYYESGGFCYHHGTLLVDTDAEKMGRYLTVSQEKLRAKGVSSVRSRVINLKELCPKLTVLSLKKAMREAFAEVYGMLPKEREIPEEIARLREKYASWDWKYGRKLPFTHRIEGRFLWGGIELALEVNGGVVREAALYTDALDLSAAGFARELEGCLYERDALCSAAERSAHLTEAVRADLAELLRTHI